MSFSSRVKEEVCHTATKSLAPALAELFAVVTVAGNIALRNRGMALRMHFEYLPVAKRVYQLLHKYMEIDCEIKVTENKLKKKNSYTLEIDNTQTVQCLLEKLGFPQDNTLFLSHLPPEAMLSHPDRRAAFLRGVFLGCGTMSHPKKNYHMEFVVNTKDFAYCLLNIVKSYKIIAKIVFRKQSYVVYLKSGDDISSLLAVIGANSSVLELENIRILKDMRNNVNRAVNCETANISKTVDAALRQLKAIQLIEKKLGVVNLSEPLAEAAMLRMNNPEATLTELAELSTLGSTKSGINHRFRKLTKIAEELLSKEDLS